MRLPKTVKINGRNWKVVRLPRERNSHFSYKTRIIEIGCQRSDDTDELRGFLHEVAEISSVEHGIRCITDKERGANGDIRFFADHDQFEYIIGDIVNAVKRIMRLK